MFIFLHSIFLCCKLTIIFPLSSSQIWQLRNSKRWPPHMWLLSLRPSGFDGGTPPPRSKSRTNFPLVFLLERQSSKTCLTKFFSGLKCIYNFSFYICSFVYFTFLTIGLFYHSWRKGLRLRSHHLKMNISLILNGFLWRIFCNPPIMLSIGGLFYGTKLSWCILTKELWNLLNVSISWSLRKAP